MVFTDTPLTVPDVGPQGPAQPAGLRRGETVLAINGQAGDAPAVSAGSRTARLAATAKPMCSSDRLY